MDERTYALAAALRERMDRETGLFVAIGIEVERLRESFQQKSWGSSLAIAQEIERTAASLEKLDGDRDEAFVLLREAMDMPRESAFSAVMPGLPDDLRRPMEDSWRALRMAVVRLKTATGRLRYSAEALADALNRILEQVLPYRKGRIYSRKGTPTSVGGAVLVDRRL